ncbi:hypothetical protein [Seleniivibrio woodruffii]|uniref:PH (Pleckstrin Homology) domain-containing protein n=1 Tax=Seleniivibrio woodruffii TaxID=1078050 RepID=A0A4R1K8A7_9BACT|nr:hypothetical protein [Seleniivibrio woodruffii]TCK60542.1 hypothetical protein C8D98_1419 [Seleniivibrio woodruffii]TVZ36170.1 hypothetical protein OF66_1794 [Seleniivibrio woodruffii]
MTVYKISRKLVYGMIFLFVSSLFFSYSFLVKDTSGGASAICAVVTVFLLYNLVSMLVSRFSVEDGELRLKNLMGDKSIRLSDLEEIGIVNLRWRVILILSDPNKFVFISSLYGNFEDFLNMLKDSVPESVKPSLDKITPKTVRNKKMFLVALMAAGSLFFIGSGLYNLLYR